MNVATSLPPCHLTQLTSCVNYAIFQGEVLRRYDLAADICRDGYRKIKEKLQVVDLSASQTFNWFLISHNLAAFESCMVVLLVRFNPDTLKLHEAVEPRAIDAVPAAVHMTPHGGHSTPSHGYFDGTRASPQSSPTRKTEMDLGFACFGARERLCLERLRGAPENAVCPSKMEPDPSMAARAAVHPWKRAVQRWLRSRPLFRWEELEHAKEKDEKAKDRDTDSMDGRGHRGEGDTESLPKGLAQIRWVEHTEHVIIPAGHDSSESENEEGHGPVHSQKDDETEVCMRKIRQIVRDTRDGDAGELHSFVLSCSIRLKPGSLEGGKLQKGTSDAEWLRGFMIDLKGIAASSRGREPSEPCRKQVCVQTIQGLSEMLEHMDLGAGLVRRTVHVGEDLLFPGDTLLMEGQLAGRDVRNFVRSVREGSVHVPITLVFLQGLQVEHVEVLAMAPYSEVHQHFVGFRETGNLKMNPTPPTSSQSLISVAGELLTDASSQSRGGKVAPRRLRDLSARRNPTKAGTRGCK